MHKQNDNSINGFQFEFDLLRVMKNHQSFREIIHNPKYPNSTFQPDISASYEGKHILIECKFFSSLSDNRLNQIINQMNSYKESIKNTSLILAIPGELSSRQLNELKNHNIELWDLPVLAKIFSQQIYLVESPKLYELLYNYAPKEFRSIEEKLINDIKDCPAGKDHGIPYQKLCTKVYLVPGT